MERQRLNEILSNPADLAQKDVAGLEALIEKYPWFSSAHLLLALEELDNDNMLLTDSLGRSAVAVPDRSPLFEASRNNASVQEVDSKEAGSTLRVVTEEVPETVEAAQDTERPSEIPEQEEQSTEHDLPITKHITQFDGDDELDKLIRSEVAKNTVTIDLLQQKIESFSPESRSEEKNVEPVEKEQSEEEVPTEEPFVPVGKGGRLSFTQWLEPSKAQKSPESRNTDPEQQLERFLASKKERAKEKVEFFSPSKMAKRSLEDDAGLVTETLAKIHQAQGNTEKAIETYKRLAEKHPEREKYFLSMAQKLERDGSF